MKSISNIAKLAVFALPLSVGACSDKDVPRGVAGPPLTISVAPLTLPGIAEAFYDVEVATAGGQTVFNATGLSSTQFGNGQGAITYVGTCDASPGANPHRVTLTLTRLFDETRELFHPADFFNPTPVVRADVICRENADTLVEFNLTIMRSADQGFFDIAVNFEDVFCSAKVDCRSEFLHDDDGDRGPTAIFAFACTSGEGPSGPEPTWMYLSDVVVTCTWSDTTVYTYQIPLMPEGRGDAIPANLGVFATSIFRGEEGFADIDKCYVNTAIGLDIEQLTRDGEVGTCTLTARASASADRWTPLATPSTSVYPVIHVDVALTTSTGQLCINNALNELGSGVQTDYTVAEDGTITPEPFSWVFGCGDAETRCAGVIPGVNDEVHVADQGDGSIVVSVGGDSGTYALPTGATYRAECCAVGCCEP